MPTKEYIVVVSDCHIGSTVGLWPEIAYSWEDGGEYAPNDLQKWLYRCWLNMLAEVKDLPTKPTLILNGDLVQGQNLRDGQLCTQVVEQQQEVAIDLLDPLCKDCNDIYVIRGTPFHDGKTGQHSRMIAKDFGAITNPETGQQTWWQLFLDLGGHTIEFSHHIPGSSIPQYQATALLRDTMNMIGELNRYYGDTIGLKTVIRSHRHKFVKVGIAPGIQGAICPCWQYKTEYGYKRGITMLPDIGWLLLEWDGEDLAIKERIYIPPKPQITRGKNGG